MRSTRSGRSAAALTAAALCGTLLLTGCDGAGRPPAADTPAPASTATSTPATSTPTAGTPATAAPTATPPPAPPATGDPAPSASVPATTPQGERLVAATVSGGFDGRHRSVVVNGDGGYTALDRTKPPKSGRMGARELAELKDALADADFAELPRVSKADPPVMDGITTTVIHRGHEVTTDGMKELPELDRVIAALPGLG